MTIYDQFYVEVNVNNKLPKQPSQTRSFHRPGRTVHKGHKDVPDVLCVLHGRLRNQVS